MIHRILNQAKALRTLRKTGWLIQNLVGGVSQEAAITHRDGPDGWNVLEIVCHLRDYERAWRERIEQALTIDNPTFQTFDHLALIHEHQYAKQNLAAVLADLRSMRATLIARLEALDDSAWQRIGMHPEQGSGSVLDLAINAGLHDLDHFEQLTRMLDGGFSGTLP